MSVLAADVPETAIKSGIMVHHWFSKLRLVAFLLVLGTYIYILYYVKTAYMRSKRLDSIEKLVLKNDKLISHIHKLDRQLVMRANNLNEFYEDY